MEEQKKNNIITVNNLDISFKTTAGMVHAIRGVNIELERGMTAAIVGESGSGKSVTMKAAMGILDKNAIVNSGETRSGSGRISTAGKLPWSSRTP